MADLRGPERTVTGSTLRLTCEAHDGTCQLVTMSECDHVAHLNPTMTYKVGSMVRCFDCGIEGGK